jgi:hypothetical protein
LKSSQLRSGADEDEGRIVDADLVLAILGRTNRNLIALSEAHAAAGILDRHHWVAGNLGLQKRHALRPLALAIHDFAARLEPGRFELANDVVDGLHLGARIDAAALVSVRPERLDVLRQALRAEAARVGGNDGNRHKRDCGRGEQMNDFHSTLSPEVQGRNRRHVRR